MWLSGVGHSVGGMGYLSGGELLSGCAHCCIDSNDHERKKSEMILIEERWAQLYKDVDRSMEFFAPRVDFAGSPSQDFEACMEWSADLVMWASDGESPEFAEFSVGYLRCTAVDLTRGEPVEEVFDALSADLEVFCSAFDGGDVREDIQDQFEAPFFGVLALEVAEIAPPFRGHKLGAWLAAEVIARLAPYPYVLVLGYPHPFGPTFPEITDKQAVGKLRRHWRHVGLEPLRGVSHLLGQSTERRNLHRARSKLNSTVDSLKIQFEPKAS